MATLCDTRQLRYVAVVTIVVYLLSRISAWRCMFDAVKPTKVVQANVQYLPVLSECMNNDGRCKRHLSDGPVDEDLFQPIRIHAYFSSTVEISINAVQRPRLMNIISRIVSTATSIFSGKF